MMGAHYRTCATAQTQEKKTKLPTCAKEGEEQATLFHWAAMQQSEYPELALLFHIPNGGKRGKAEAACFKMEGVKAGVPDLFLPVAVGNRHGLFIEMKRVDGGKVSREQTAWGERLTEQGHAWIVCRGWEEAAAMLKRYLDGLWE